MKTNKDLIIEPNAAIEGRKYSEEKPWSCKYCYWWAGKKKLKKKQAKKPSVRKKLQKSVERKAKHRQRVKQRQKSRGQER